MKVYRFNLSKDKFDEFLQKGEVSILQGENLSTSKDLEEFLSKKENSKFKVVVNNFFKLKKDDYIWLRAGKEFSCGKILEDPYFDKALRLRANFKKILIERVPEKIRKLRGGQKLIAIRDEDIYRQSEDIFNIDNRPIKFYANEGLITISDNKNSYEERKILTPALREKNQLSLYKEREDIRISYKKERSKNKDKKNRENNFELILEMNPKKDHIEEKNLLPMIFEDIKEKNLVKSYGNLLKLQMDFAFEFTKNSMINIGKMNIKFWQEYLKILNDEINN